MSLLNFRSYKLAVEFAKRCERFRCPYVHRDQLTRASLSVALNLAEGSAKQSAKERARFYSTSLASLRECQTIFEVLGLDQNSELANLTSQLGAHLYKLTKACQRMSTEKSRDLIPRPRRKSEVESSTPDDDDSSLL